MSIDKALVRYLAAQLPYATVGRQFGISRQRVHQIVKETDKPPKVHVQFEYTCACCGIVFYSTNEHRKYCSRKCSNTANYTVYQLARINQC